MCYKDVKHSLVFLQVVGFIDIGNVHPEYRLYDVDVTEHAESLEDEEDRNGLLCVGHVCVDPGHRSFHFDAEGELVGVGAGEINSRPYLRNPGLGLKFGSEEEDIVLGQFLLADDNLLGAVDDEVAPLVLGALIEVDHVLGCGGKVES